MIDGALIDARMKYSDIIEGKVRCALEAIIAEGKTPSFYNVASRAQVARSTLYRKPELKALVIAARDASWQQVPPPVTFDDLLAENLRLRNEVRMLEEKLRRMSGSIQRDARLARSRMVYAIMDLPKAA